MNRLRKIFEPSNGVDKKLEIMKQNLIADRSCLVCKHGIEQPRTEMGYDSGTVPYCDVFNELQIGYSPQICMFWELEDD